MKISTKPSIPLRPFPRVPTSPIPPGGLQNAANGYKRSNSVLLAVEFLEARRLLAVTPIGPEFRVNTTTTGDQFAPAVATDNAGNFVAVWSADSTTSGHAPDTEIFAQRYNSFGVAQGPEFRVNTFTSSIQASASVAMDADGDFIVVWESGPADTLVDPAQDGSGFGIYAQRYNAAGVPQGVEFRINGTTTNNQRAPEIACDANGNFVVTWQSAAQDGSGYGVYARRFNNVGGALAAEFRANSFTTDNQLAPSVAVDQDGDFVVAWTSGNLAAGQDGSFYGIYAQRYNALGVIQGGEFRVNSFTTDFQTFPSVAMDNAGNFVVAWSSFGQDGSNYGVYAQRYSAAGVTQGGEFLVNTATTNSQSQPRVDRDINGNFAILWSSEAQDGSGRGTFGKYYNSAGAVQGGEFQVNTFIANDQSRPAVALASSGDFVVAFQDGSDTPGVNGQDGSGYGVYARRYTVATDTIPPKVNSAVFNFATSHSVTIVFSENVAPGFTTADVQLVNLTTMTTIPTGSLAISYAGGTNPATLTFPGLPNQRLPDGNYQLTLLAAGITDGVGNQLDGNGNGVGGDNFVLNFFFLSGDANHDKIVNVNDFTILAGNFGLSGRNFTQGDFNYDGIVNINDFTILASKFGQSLPAQTSAASIGAGKFSTRRIDDPGPTELPASL